MMRRPRCSGRVRTAVIPSLLIVATLLVASNAVGQLFGGTGAPDVIIDATVWGPATYMGLSDGTNVSPVSQPVGGTLRQNATYDVRFTGLDGSQSTGYGSVGNATSAILVDASGLVISSAQLISDGATSHATFLSLSATRAGVMSLRPVNGNAAGNTAAAVFVLPAPRLSLSFSPPVAECSAASPDNTTAVTIRVANASGPVPGARLRGIFLPADATTGADGTYVHVGACPALGGHVVRATRDFGGASFAGEPVPEEEAEETLSFAMRPTTIRVGHHHGGLLAPARVPILIEDARDLGALTFTLTLDPGVARVVDVTAGNVTGTNATWSYNASEGILTVLVTSPLRPGPHAGSAILVDAWIERAGSVGSATTLDLAIVELADSDGVLRPANAVDGHYRAGILGDVDGDDLVRLSDASALGAVVVGARAVSTIHAGNSDFNEDGQLTGVDVMWLEQHLAGTRPEL